MCWIGISENGTIGPIFVDKGAKINSEVYIKTILKPALKTALELYPDGRFLWQHDSAPAHASAKTANYLKKHGIEFVDKEEWLPCSPDFAPCDYWLWGYLKNRVRRHTIMSVDELKKVIVKETNSIPHKLITKALRTWGDRLQDVHDRKGQHLKHRM